MILESIVLTISILTIIIIFLLVRGAWNYNVRWRRIELLNGSVDITRKNTRIDDRGYLRWKEDGYLCHRDIARRQTHEYRQRKDDLRFKDLQVHHVDGNKLNNDYRNLQALSPREHMMEHGIILVVDGTAYRRVGKETWIQEEKVTGIRIKNTWIPMQLVMFRGGNVYTEEWYYRKEFRRQEK